MAIEKLVFSRANIITDGPFKSKVIFVEALGMFEGSEGNKFLEQIKALTNIRNSIAHSMKYDEKDLNNLLKYYPIVKRKVDMYKQSDLEIFKSGALKNGLISYTIPLIYEYIISRLQSKINLNNYFFDTVDESLSATIHITENEEIKRHFEALETVYNSYP